MKPMTSSPVEAADLLDLKLLPAWVKEPVEAKRYADVEGEHGLERPARHHRGAPTHRGRRPTRDSGRSQAGVQRPITKAGKDEARRRRFEPDRHSARRGRSAEDRPRAEEHPPVTRTPLQITIRFLPYSPAFESDVTESEPIKGNFSNIARCRLSGTLLGPTNHHNYQLQLRSLYEQRFSRRMSFADYQRQIEIVNDAALIERWKGEARKVTTYTTSREEVPLTFSSPTEAERHFRSHYLEALVKGVEEATIGGVLSRRLSDRVINRTVEDAWVRETRSPSAMMQELAGRSRQNGLHVFRHRRGMLFVSPIRTRAFVHEQAGVSRSVNAILEALAGAEVINRKQLFEKLIGNVATEDVEPRKLALVSDLRWLINEGYVIEFNDGSLDLPRGKAKPREALAPDVAAEAVEHGSSKPAEQTLALVIWRGPYSLTILSEGAESPSS